MKRAFLFFTAIFFTGSLSAQNISGGLRAGLESWMHLDQKLHGSGKYTTFTPEFFIRAQSKKHWALELNLNQSLHNFETIQFNYIDEWTGISFFGTRNHTTKRCDLNLKAEYAFNCSFCGAHCSRSTFFKNYIGIIAGPSFLKNGYTLARNDLSEPHKSNEKSTEIWAGLSNTVTSQIRKHWLMSGSFSWQINLGGGAFSSFYPSGVNGETSYPDSKFSGYLGLGYKF